MSAIAPPSPDFSIARWGTSLRKGAVIGVEILLAFPLSLAMKGLGIGSLACILAGLLVGALVLWLARTCLDVTAQPNPIARKLGQTLVGFAIGCSITQDQIAQISAQLPVLIGLTLLMLLSGTAIGFFYSWLSQTNLLTALLATVPGGVGIMSSLAADYGRNVTQVALVQVIRVTTVILLIPFVARTITGELSIPEPLVTIPAFQPDSLHLVLLLLAVITAVVGIQLSKRLRIPSAPFFGALVAGITFNPLLAVFPWLVGLHFTPPMLINLLGHILLGITIGEYWGSGAQLRKRAIADALVPVILTILAGFLMASLAKALTPWDWLTCLLVTAPGGAPEMILVALALHHSVETITAGHLVRLIAINGSLPLWLWLFRLMDSQTVDDRQHSLELSVTEKQNDLHQVAPQSLVKAS